jgi:hypothetical protein
MEGDRVFTGSLPYSYTNVTAGWGKKRTLELRAVTVPRIESVVKGRAFVARACGVDHVPETNNGMIGFAEVARQSGRSAM